MRTQVLIIDNNDSFTFNLVQSFKYINCETKVVNINSIKDLNFDNYHNIVLSPGPGLPDENPNLINFIHEHKEHKKILGVCLGLQAITLAFGGSLINLDKPRHGQSEKLTILNESTIYKDLEDVEVGLYHSWAANPKDFPSDLIIDAVDSSNIIMSIHHKKYKITGVQYHPESIITKKGLKLLINWLGK